MLSNAERWLLLAFVGHFALVALLYALLTVVRLRAVRAGEAKVGDFARASGDPPAAARVRRNLANQFEAPVLGWIAVAVLLWAGAVGSWDAIAAWVLLAGRVIHACVQVLTDNVALRGQVYVISFLPICFLVGHVGWIVVQGT